MTWLKRLLAREVAPCPPGAVAVLPSGSGVLVTAMAGGDAVTAVLTPADARRAFEDGLRIVAEMEAVHLLGWDGLEAD